jgi:hypothetical protein
MKQHLCVLAAAGGVLMAMSTAPVSAQKQGGILRQYI